MDEQFAANVERLMDVVERLAAVLPEEPQTELEAVAAELTALAIEHLALIEGALGEGEDMEDDEGEMVEEAEQPEA